VLVEDVAASAARLDATFARMTPAGWEAEGITRSGPVPARRLIGARWREIEIHRVDLDDGYGPGDWPASFVAPLLPSLLDPERLGPRLPVGVAVGVADSDSGRRWEVGPPSARRVAVVGPSWALAAWLLGRPEAVRDQLGSPPPLSPWL
jgi:maleylpyruvate isomerase